MSWATRGIGRIVHCLYFVISNAAAPTDILFVVDALEAR